MTTVITAIEHGFLSPGHNCWLIWTSGGSQQLTNPGASHRALESLAFALDQATGDGWVVEKICTDAQGAPQLVLLTRPVRNEG